MWPRAPLTSFLTACMVATLSVTAQADPPDERRRAFGSRAVDSTIHVAGTVTGLGARDRQPSTASAAPPEYAYRRAPVRFCGTGDAWTNGLPCVDGAPSGDLVRQCADGSDSLDPLFRRPLDASGAPVGLWERVDDGGCPEDGPTADAVVLTGEDFRRLPLVPSSPAIQPGHGRALVNVELIVFTDDSVQELETTVLGTPVAVRARPVGFSWDFGDGTSLHTEDPGAPYPTHTTGHVYTVAGEYDVTLTTTWSGQYQVDRTGPWLPVAGTATTTSTPVPLSLEEARSRLVADPVP